MNGSDSGVASDLLSDSDAEGFTCQLHRDAGCQQNALPEFEDGAEDENASKPLIGTDAAEQNLFVHTPSL